MSVEDDVRALLKDSSSPIDDELLNKRSDDDKKPIAEIEIAVGTNNRESGELGIVPILSKYDQVVGSDSPIISQIATTAVMETSKTTGNRSSYTVEQPKPIEPFDWCKYLRETQSQSAPEDCFFQNPKIPINMFREEKKLELPDPRGSTIQKLLSQYYLIHTGPGCLCLGTIQALHSVWVCVRLDGCDDTNDQWIICDDKDLHPVGYCAKSGANLQPPVGFRPNLAHFHKFLETQLKRSSLRIDADGSDTMMNSDDNPACPEDWFQPISDELHPKTNRFIVGHKVEAIDHKNFNGRVCPATIVNVDGDHIEINFDGWNHAYNVKERYDSRHIFPVGWAKKVGLEVQPPRQTKRKSRSSVNSLTSSVPVTIAAATPAPATVRSRAKRGRKAYTPTVDEDMDEDLPISSAIDTLRLKVAKRGRGNRQKRKLRIAGNTDTSEPIELPPVAISTSPETTTTTATASVVPIRIRLVPTERRNTNEKSSPPQCYRLNEALRRLQMSKGAEQRDTSETASDDLSTSSPPPSLQQHYGSDVRVTDVGNESNTKKQKQSEFTDNAELKKDANTVSSKSTIDIINKTGTSTTSQDHRNSEKHLKTTVDNNVSSVNARARKTFTMRTTPVVATTIASTTTVTSVVPIAPKTVTAASNNIDSTRNRVELLNTQQQSFASTMLLPGIVVQRMPTTTRLNSSSTTTTTTSSSHNMILSSSETQSTTSHIPANTSPDIVLSSSDNIAWEQLQMTVYLNRNCSCGSLLNASKLVALPQQIGPANMHHIIRETIQQLVNAADNTRLVFRKIEAGLPRVLCVTAEINGFTHVRTLPTFKDLPRAWQYLRTFVDRLGVCPNFLTQKPIACQMCAPVLRRADDNDDEEEDDDEEEKHHIAVTSPTESANCSSTGGRKRKRSTKTTTRASTDESDESSTATERGGEVSGNTSQAHNKLALEHWSVDDVADSLLSIADASISYKFRNNQIDGKALLLLTTDLMMKHMDLAFGPALKIMAHVENLKHL